MTQQEKQLLLKDLCARLPYGIKCCAKYNTGSRYNTNVITVISENGSIVTRQNELHYQQSSLIEDCRPYLRPMSSMTKEEKEEYDKTFDWDYSIQGTPFDWLNEHHFDYRGLIEKSLAIVAPEGMYKIE